MRTDKNSGLKMSAFFVALVVIEIFQFVTAAKKRQKKILFLAGFFAALNIILLTILIYGVFYGD